MQQRFCTCGTRVWVNYIFANMRWLAFFYRGEAAETGTTRCPCCGQSLNIETLR